MQQQHGGRQADEGEGTIGQLPGKGCEVLGGAGGEKAAGSLGTAHVETAGVGKQLIHVDAKGRASMVDVSRVG